MKKRSFLHETGSGLGPVEILVLSYQVLVGLVVFFGRLDVPKGPFLLWHLGGSILLVWFCRAVPSGRQDFAGFVREWYPLIVMLFLYREVGPLIHGLFEGSLDQLLFNMDRSLFLGGGPALWEWQATHPPSRWLNEFFNVGYGFYFFLMPIGGFALWLKGTRTEFKTYMFSLTLTYFAHYLLFILLPAHSPRYFIPGLREALPGFLWSDILKVAVEGNAYPGASFPSSHVAAACVVFMAYPRMGRWKILFFSLTLLLFAGTVWGRYHYVSDLAAGLLTGWFFYRFSPSVEAVFQGWIRNAKTAVKVRR
jgi:hypothetical protein